MVIPDDLASRLTCIILPATHRTGYFKTFPDFPGLRCLVGHLEDSDLLDIIVSAPTLERLVKLNVSYYGTPEPEEGMQDLKALVSKRIKRLLKFKNLTHIGGFFQDDQLYPITSFKANILSKLAEYSSRTSTLKYAGVLGH
ncbi:hypothetical protein M422DRAFT_47215 [Sphaerobolus stellatus SS14]|uniref:Uncharacterized protein n=1 Tax=Sphaerobolus stellatus (strain SS14) TaxID=990650 RepID=A0A0C9W105_SPHS4|nr:hypothetical protein M422DRAFT_47215 [Sphaerobolus stellatus SS14]